MIKHAASRVFKCQAQNWRQSDCHAIPFVWNAWGQTTSVSLPPVARNFLLVRNENAPSNPSIPCIEMFRKVRHYWGNHSNSNTILNNPHLVVSIGMGTQCRPQNTSIAMMGIPKWYLYGSESKPCARWPARTSLCYIPLKRGACYIPLVARCRAAIKDLEYSWYCRACRARGAPVTYPL